MNVAQKPSTAGFTILLILLAGASLHGQSYRYVFYQNSTSALHTLYAQTGCDSSCVWDDVNWQVSAVSGSPMTVNPFGAGLEFFYIGAGQQIEMIDNVNPTATWSVGVCVSCNTGAPAAAAGSALASAVDYSASITHVFYEGANGHIYHLWCNCAALTPTWHWDDVTSLAGGHQ